VQRSVILMALVAVPAVAALAAPKTPSFFARRDYPGLYSTFVQVADVNGGGIKDIITTDQGVVTVLFGNGNGTFRTGPTTDANGSTSFAAVRLVAGGPVDLVFPVGTGITLWTGNGNGTFQSAGPEYTVNDTGLTFMVTGDFNGDGILDVATPGGLGVWLFTGKGDGTFNPAVLAASLPPGSDFIAAADLNDDQNLDLVVTSLGADGSGAGFVVLMGNGDGTFRAPLSFSQPKKAIALAVGNLGKGGTPGIALGVASKSYVSLYVGNGSGGLLGPTYVNLPGVEATGLTLGDVNGDGLADLISSNGYVAYGQGGGKFTKPVSYPVANTGQGAENVVLAQLVANGPTDMVFSIYNAISVLLNEGKGTFDDGVWTSVTAGGLCGVAADFNGDGKPDLAVANVNGVSILLGTGTASEPYSLGATISLPDAECLAAGDLNGDNIPDLLVSVKGTEAGRTVVAYLGNGDGTFTLTSTIVSPVGPQGIYLALGDFNHDGKLDFATSGNELAYGNGDGTFQAPVDIVANPPGAGFSGIAAGDINNDGWLDLVLTNNYGGFHAFVMLNNQHNGFTQLTTYFGEYTDDPVLADLNGDGYLDLVLFNTSTTPNGPPIAPGIYLGNGKGDFTYKESLSNPFGNAAGLTLVADVNGDGIPDICALVSNTVSIFLGEGGANYATPFSIGTGPSPGDILVSNLHGQSLTAGLPDIVAPDSSGGVMVLINTTKQ
jgi:hypothetical protein